MIRKSNTAAILASKQPDTALEKAAATLLSSQQPSGYWVFDLEADVTIPSEYVFLRRILQKPLENKIAERLRNYILGKQLPDGGWPLYDVDGFANLSTSVKAYLALKILGEDQNAPHMTNARTLILNLGGAASANVFTRIALAMLGQVPWHTPPAMPVEMILLPRWFFFHLSKMSYWSRTVVVPLLIIYEKKPVCRLRPDESIPELFITPPESLGTMDPFRWDRFIRGRWRKNVFILMDRLLKRIEPYMPRFVRNTALEQAERWTLEHMGGSGGIGAIFPAMANALMALKALGYPEDHPDFARGMEAVDDLVIHRFKPDPQKQGGPAFLHIHGGNSAAPAVEIQATPGLSACGDFTTVQPCVSPVWDTCLTLSALMEAGISPEHPAVHNCVSWLFAHQVFVRGDWADKAPNLEPGGWAFQFENAQYPDVDDTCSVVMALIRAGAHVNSPKKRHRIEKAVNWVVGMQNKDGGWGAFDINNDALYLNDIPFADHGALLDPSTADVTGRCVEMLGMLGHGPDCPPTAKAIGYLRDTQEQDGSWFGRWGVNYIYGTWSVLCGLRMAGEDMAQPYVKKAVSWLKSRQNENGGWGETCYSYFNPEMAGMGDSTPSQTSWALMALIAAGEIRCRETLKGIRYLLDAQDDNGIWEEEHFTGTGFPKVFYLRYQGYSRYFPLWTLAVYQRAIGGKKTLAELSRQEGLHCHTKPCQGGVLVQGPVLIRAVKKAAGAVTQSLRLK